jgi:prolipoprotein diacylglyceryltransferase
MPGVLAGVYFLAYATIRFGLEYIRLDRPTLAGLPVAQIVSLGTVLVWIGLLYWRTREPPTRQVDPA